MVDALLDRLRGLNATAGTSEIKMFGGVCFMLNGNMLVCAMRDGSLLARIGATAIEAALQEPGVSQMNMNGRTMKDYIVVAPSALDDASLGHWLAAASTFVEHLPAKAARAPEVKQRRELGA